MSIIQTIIIIGFTQLADKICDLLSGERSKDPNYPDYNTWFF